MSRFPFPMPFGWFKVAMPDEIPEGKVVTRRMFGTDLVLWRDAEGRVVCQEAFCAHLGAHLGVGGTVESSCIRCPFHGWAWGPAGENVDIPYGTRPNRKAKLRTYPTREHVGIVFAWYHPSGAAPLWELMSIPEYEDPEFGEYQVFDFTIRTCLQEMGENGFDHTHFQFVHSHPKVGTVEKIEFRGFDRTVLTSQEIPVVKGSGGCPDRHLRSGARHGGHPVPRPHRGVADRVQHPDRRGDDPPDLPVLAEEP